MQEGTMFTIETIEQLEAIYGQPGESSTVKVADRITSSYRVLIEKSVLSAWNSQRRTVRHFAIRQRDAGAALENVARFEEFRGLLPLNGHH